MEKEEMNNIVSKLNHKELLTFLEIIEKELRLSRTAIKEGLE